MSKHLSFNFTIAALNKLPVPQKGITTYKDQKNPSLRLYVTSTGTKTFLVRKRIKGRDERLIIGRFPDLTIEQARKQATVYCGLIADRKDPLEEQRLEKSNRLTFGEHFKEYMERYSKPHKKSWKYDEQQINKHVSHWFKRRLSDISKREVEKLHERLGRENGRVQANIVVRRLSAIFNKAIAWGWSGTNPTVGVQRFKEISRDRFVQPHEMPHLIKALQLEGNETLRDFISMLFLTGARKTNTRMMRWEQINWDRTLWRIPDSKNSETLTIPLTGQAMNILMRRKTSSLSGWVFPQDANPKKCIVDPIKAWHRIIALATLYIWEEEEGLAAWVCDQSAAMLPYLSDFAKAERLIAIARDAGFDLPLGLMDLRIHDIRRTFGSYQILTGASMPIVGKSLGHKSLKSTQVYARLNLDPVRSSIEKATEAMFSI